MYHFIATVFDRDVLAIGSEVFLAMFYGDSANNHDIIDIPDTDPTAFGLMMRYEPLHSLSQVK